MDMNYCMHCGARLRLKRHETEGDIPWCDGCGDWRFPVFSTAVSTVILNPDRTRTLLIQQYGRPFYILCADTALQPLLKNGIKPDGVFVEEAQSVISKAFIGIPQGIQIFAGLSSIPNIVHRAGPENLSYFFTEYTNALFIDEMDTERVLSGFSEKPISSGVTMVTESSLPSCRLDRPSTTTISLASTPSLMM